MGLTVDTQARTQVVVGNGSGITPASVAAAAGAASPPPAASADAPAGGSPAPSGTPRPPPPLPAPVQTRRSDSRWLVLGLLVITLLAVTYLLRTDHGKGLRAVPSRIIERGLSKVGVRLGQATITTPAAATAAPSAEAVPASPAGQIEKARAVTARVSNQATDAASAFGEALQGLARATRSKIAGEGGSPPPPAVDASGWPIVDVDAVIGTGSGGVAQIDGEVYGVGETLSNGMVLKGVTEAAVFLEYRGETKRVSVRPQRR